MRLLELLNGVECDKSKVIDCEISDIETDSSKVSNGALFIAIKGRRDNGEKYAKQAIENGAVAIISENFIEGIDTIIVTDIRKAYATISANFYNNPARKLKVIAVVGTNGKSTCAHFVHHILSFNGIKVGLIGTGKVIIGNKVIFHDMTTPDPKDIHRYFRDMVSAHIEYVVIEVSAHAIYLDKMYGIKCELGLFTNFSEDHLDYFGKMDIYKRVKMSFFNSRYIKVGIVNSDDECGREIMSSANVPTFTYGLENPSDVFAIDLEYCIDSTRFVVNMLDEISHFATEIVGKYNVYNILGASLVARLLDIPMYAIRDAVATMRPPEGRYEKLTLKDRTFVIDYAHTPTAMQNVISETRRLSNGNIIVVFGCGGDRDREKRSIMGHIASSLADNVVLTSDNSRNENTTDIIEDIMQGVEGDNVTILEDRKQAIEYAYDISDDGDTILVLGKGAENYQDNGFGKIYYSDREAILNIIND